MTRAEEAAEMAADKAGARVAASQRSYVRQIDYERHQSGREPHAKRSAGSYMHKIPANSEWEQLRIKAFMVGMTVLAVIVWFSMDETHPSVASLNL